MPGTHGGAQFEFLGDDLTRLDLRSSVVPADVLDAWFDPAPSVIEVLRREAAWMSRSSPPARAVGLEREIAERFGVSQDCVALGAGSSDLIFRCLTSRLTRDSCALLLDPTYSEYRHVCEKVVGCSVQNARSLCDVSGSFDLIVVVNPNNPTGELFRTGETESLASHLKPGGVVWVDEAYMQFVEESQSVKRLAAEDAMFVVCQSLSKSLALSGLRAACLVGHPDLVRSVRERTPPWVVSTPALLAALAALQEPGYYAERYRQTRVLRRSMVARMRTFPRLNVKEGEANWLCLETPLPAQVVVQRCRERGVLVRGGEGMFLAPPEGFVRVAVRSEAENLRSVEALAFALQAEPAHPGGR